jgi:ribonuclease VapC
MFVDAAAIVAVMANEPEAERCSAAIHAVEAPFISPIVYWEAATAMARPDKSSLPLADCLRWVTLFLEQNGIEIRQLPPPDIAAAISGQAAVRYRNGPRRLNLADCFHYACARHYGAAMLSTAGEFRFTDLQVVD